MLYHQSVDRQAALTLESAFPILKMNKHIEQFSPDEFFDTRDPTLRPEFLNLLKQHNSLSYGELVQLVREVVRKSPA